jgi:hypothetical protein
MDWALVIDRNSIALKTIIDGLFALLGLATRLPHPVYRRILRLLRPAESAVRRLIVIAARGIVVEVAPIRVRPAPVKSVASPTVRPKGTQRSYAFQLFDPRKPFLKIAKRKVLRVAPRIRLLDWGHDPRISAQFPPPRPPAPPPPPVPDGLVDAARITRRLQALNQPLMICRARLCVSRACSRRGRRVQARHSRPPCGRVILQDSATEGVTRSMRFSSSVITSPWTP